MLRRSAGRVLGLLLVAGCSGGRGDAATGEALTVALERTAQGGAALAAPEVVGGDWTRLAFVCPYEERPAVEDRLGFAWADFPGADLSEGVATWVFATDRRVVTWATLSRQPGDPCGGSQTPAVVDRSDATFAVTRNGSTSDGRPFYGLVLQR